MNKNRMNNADSDLNNLNTDSPDDQLIFADETEKPTDFCQPRPNWKVIIVDDEPEVHSITKMVLRDYSFLKRSIDFISAFSAGEAKAILAQETDAAIIILDVVMETDDAGLKLVKYIREELKNRIVRIIMRTGQPGKAPENDIITNYDINDYKAKTELTTQKLFTTVTTALRSYNDLLTIEKNRRGLELILNSSAQLFRYQSLKKFAAGVLTQLLAILKLSDDAMYMRGSVFAAACGKEDLSILAATGQYEDFIQKPIHEVLPPKLHLHIEKVMKEKTDLFIDDCYIGYSISQNGTHNLLYLTGCDCLSEVEKNLVRIFASNVSIAFDNIYLARDVVKTQKEVIYTLGEVVETRSKETANHVQRVAQMSKLMALLAGLGEKTADIIKMASPMHDIGKIGMPDAIMSKPESLTIEEFEIIKTHPEIGYEILKKSNREIMQAAAIIAHEHHERWDGMGYPAGLMGDEIHIYGRITAIADVFDALTHKRIYKPAWTHEEAAKYIKSQEGKHFDPVLTKLFIDNLSEFVAINKTYEDEGEENGGI